MVSLGDRTLDEALDGGIPDRSAVLVTGTAGAGKSTLGMQFLVEGASNGERCLLFSTEQTRAELSQSLESLEFSTDAVDVATVHGRVGQSLSDDGFVLSTGNDDGVFQYPFTSENVLEHVADLKEYDRVVVDSVAGLAPLTETDRQLRNVVLDLTRRFTERHEATVLVTDRVRETLGGETNERVVPASSFVEHAMHGVIELWQERVRGEYHRFLRIKKMRGRDHDSRPYEMRIADDGLHAIPRERISTADVVDDAALSTGIDGLDSLLGGGIHGKGVTTVTYDSETYPTTVTANVAATAYREGYEILLLPWTAVRSDDLNFFAETLLGEPIDDILEDGRLHLFDVHTPAGKSRQFPELDSHERLYTVGKDVDAFVDELSERYYQAERPVLSIFAVEPLMATYGPDNVRTFYQQVEGQLSRPGDTSLYFFNPDVIPNGTGEFLRNVATQDISLWRSESGIQYCRLDAGPFGRVGSSRVVEYLPDPPFVSVR